MVYGLGGNDTIHAGNSAEEVLIPGRGNNTVYTRVLNEGDGNKTFLWNPGDGNSTIYYDNPARVSGDGLAVLRFGPGVSSEDVTFYNSGSNLVFQVTMPGSSAAKLTFINANTGYIRYHMDETQFADGTVWKWSKMNGQ